VLQQCTCVGACEGIEGVDLGDAGFHDGDGREVLIMKRLTLLAAGLVAMLGCSSHGGNTIPCVEDMPGMIMCSQTVPSPATVKVPQKAPVQVAR
jgi:hypothetical protein